MRAIFFIVTLLSICAVVAFEPATIDTTHRPQDDFYRYANGVWLESHSLPKGIYRYNELSELENMMLHAVSERLARGKLSGSRSEHVLVTYYRAGMDDEADQGRERDILLDQVASIEESMGKGQIMEAIARLQAIGVDSFFRIHDPEKWQVPEQHYLILMQPYLNVSSSDNDNYREFLRELFTLIGYSEEEALSKADAAIRIETGIASFLQPQPRSPWDLYNKVSVSAVAKWFEPMEFGVWFDGLSISTDQDIVIDHPKYFEQLGSWLQQADRADLTTYIVARLLLTYCRYMHGDFKLARAEFYRKQYGLELTDPVVEQMMRDLPEYLNEFYLQEFVGQVVRERITTMVENVRAAWLKRIDANDWMGSSERERAHEKVARMEFVIGGQSQMDLLSEDTLADQLEPDDTFLEIALKSRRWRLAQTLSRIGSAWDDVRPECWSFSLTCHYDLERNMVVLSGGNFLPTRFDPKAETAANYGGLGTRIAHEMTHAIDSQGRLYDVDGKPLSWLKKWMLTSKFKKRTQPLIDQYDHFYAFEDCPVDGKATLMENLADLGGVRVALDAMHRECPDKSADRTFFISYAQSWRELITDDAQRNQCRGPHSPTMFRAYGPLQHIDEFYETFDIRPDDPMYLEPEKRAYIW